MQVRQTFDFPCSMRADFHSLLLYRSEGNEVSLDASARKYTAEAPSSSGTTSARREGCLTELVVSERRPLCRCRWWPRRAGTCGARRSVTPPRRGTTRWSRRTWRRRTRSWTPGPAAEGGTRRPRRGWGPTRRLQARSWWWHGPHLVRWWPSAASSVVSKVTSQMRTRRQGSRISVVYLRRATILDTTTTRTLRERSSM
jgi:hypothetical protein